MAHPDRFTPLPRSLLPMLVLFLVLGHACELPAYTHLGSSHAAENAGHSGQDHHAGAQISCDAVDILSNTGPVRIDAGLDVLETLPLASPPPLRLVTSLAEDSKAPPSRPPLFLLHASLLI